MAPTCAGARCSSAARASGTSPVSPPGSSRRCSPPSEPGPADWWEDDPMARPTAAVLTISDGVSSGTRADGSGDAAQELLGGAGFDVSGREVVADERGEIEGALRRLAASHALVVTTGGTGFGPRDVTPEATKAVLDREAPGL